MDLAPALRHGEFELIFPDIYFVTGMMKMKFQGIESGYLQFSRNMTVVREGNALTLINALRLDNTRLELLKWLGHVANVVQIASEHDRDNAFYKEEFPAAKFWALPRMPRKPGVSVDKELIPDGPMPFAGCSLFCFRTTKQPEGILHIDRSGGILVTGDSLQNYVLPDKSSSEESSVLKAPDKFFSEESFQLMAKMGFFQRANVGPMWRENNKPQEEDFVRLKKLQYRHVLPGHGSPVRDVAKKDFEKTFKSLYGV